MSDLTFQCWLVCGSCPDVRYVLYAREIQKGTGVNENIIWPVAGSPLPPPVKSACPQCGAALVRTHRRDDV